jgi:hypothetical protein
MQDQRIVEWMKVAAEELRKKVLLDLDIQPPLLSDYENGNAVMEQNAAIIAKHTPRELFTEPSELMMDDAIQLTKALDAIREAEKAINSLRSRVPIREELIGKPTT